MKYKKQEKCMKTLAHGYSCESTQQLLFTEYPHDRVYMVFNDRCVLVLWKKKSRTKLNNLPIEVPSQKGVRRERYKLKKDMHSFYS